MKIDFFRALGVTAGVILVDMVVNTFVYAPSVSLGTADLLAMFVSIVVIGVFSYAYFKNGSVGPSAETGFWLGCVLFAYTFASGFLGGYLSAAQDLPPSPLPQPSPLIMWGSIVIGFAVPSFVGWYLAKNK